jgi:hypothetical protein
MYYITLTLQQENLYVGLEKPKTTRTNTVKGMQALQFTHKMGFQNLTSGWNFLGFPVRMMYHLKGQGSGSKER